jgi:2-amino-4-hydroxy-6-hydroxymethyldihydropteridine diphosphokinase
MSSRAALAIGSNLGDRLALLHAGVHDLASTPGLELVAVSAVYETAPVGGPEQGAYLNAVVVVATDLGPLALLERALQVEAGHGRVRLQRWGPRTLDIDVLSFADEVSDDPVLTLPHPRAHERAFVLVPWAEVDPAYVVPGRGVTVAELLDALPPADRVGVVRVDVPDVLTDPMRAPS